jgi:hypothetical protein
MPSSTPRPCSIAPKASPCSAARAASADPSGSAPPGTSRSAGPAPRAPPGTAQSSTQGRPWRRRLCRDSPAHQSGKWRQDRGTGGHGGPGTVIVSDDCIHGCCLVAGTVGKDGVRVIPSQPDFDFANHRNANSARAFCVYSLQDRSRPCSLNNAVFAVVVDRTLSWQWGGGSAGEYGR